MISKDHQLEWAIRDVWHAKKGIKAARDPPIKFCLPFKLLPCFPLLVFLECCHNFLKFLTMARTVSQDHQEDGISVHLPAQSEITISPPLLWLIISVAAIFFISGILHFLLKFIKKKKQTYHPSVSQSNRYNQLHHPQSLGRQLQHLFRLQDSGLDQSFIDNHLPVFDYNAILISGLQDQFDCAVCLCEFSPHDHLRLIPICSHAFHTHCIDTWLLSNPTCPLCRVNLSIENHPLRNHNRPTENFNVATNNISSEISCDEKNLGKRVFSVRLGKLTSFDSGERSNEGEISRCNLDARRCYSMGSFQYVVNNIDLQVALFDVKDNVGCGKSEDDMNQRKIKYESFSVSKVWLWSKKGKFPVCSSENGVASDSSPSHNTRVPGL
ncbi:hypothetical protein L6452_39607 [Arctium lappa]|uniref:Uncharacterized protein n=1 Tax=Arctium lappa TaxID=4217 RepID=A0ACB8XWX7_ARCLA|nr:hypothetical protein L6452_39607 [Arctium lappa]